MKKTNKEKDLENAVNEFIEDRVYHFVYSHMKYVGIDVNNISYGELMKASKSIEEELKTSIRTLAFKYM